MNFSILNDFVTASIVVFLKVLEELPTRYVLHWYKDSTEEIVLCTNNHEKSKVLAKLACNVNER